MTNIEFYEHDQFFYVIKSAGEIAKEVLLSVIWNLMLIEINLFQIRILDIKREKVRAVCPYNLFVVYRKEVIDNDSMEWKIQN